MTAINTRWLATGLAIASTTTASCISILAAWQRGGWLSERLLWVALSVVLVASAHLLPALCRSTLGAARLAGAGLWVVCMAATCYGHATFFLLAQQHAGTERANAAASPARKEKPSTGRNLAAIATDRARVVTALAAANLRHCLRDCTAVRLERVSLTARLEALDVEAREAQRQEAATDRAVVILERAEQQRDAARIDPVTARVAAFLDTPTERIDLLSGLAFAGTLEGIACLLWFVALGSSRQQRDALSNIAAPASAITPEPASIATSREIVTAGESAESPDSDVARLTTDIAAGLVRATVADIRRHLGCSQSRAVALRRQLSAAVST